MIVQGLVTATRALIASICLIIIAKPLFVVLTAESLSTLSLTHGDM